MTLSSSLICYRHLTLALMKSHPMLTPILYVCYLFFLLSYLTIATSTPLYNLVENIVVNCGSPGSLKGNDDRD